MVIRSWAEKRTGVAEKRRERGGKSKAEAKAQPFDANANAVVTAVVQPPDTAARRRPAAAQRRRRLGHGAEARAGRGRRRDPSVGAPAWGGWTPSPLGPRRRGRRPDGERKGAVACRRWRCMPRSSSRPAGYRRRSTTPPAAAAQPGVGTREREVLLAGERELIWVGKEKRREIGT